MMLSACANRVELASVIACKLLLGRMRDYYC
jgi:hypothetical protein